MRSTLIVVIVLCAVMVTAGSSLADLNWSAGVTLTEKEPSMQIGSRLEAARDGRLVGSWFSSSGQLPVLVQRLTYDAFGDFPGIGKIQRVVLSPDHGKTEWPAEMVEGKGYCVKIPQLSAGAYGFEWGITSKDKKNRLMLIIIPINWSSSRKSSATNHAMVQLAPLGCEGYSDQQWFACLRGFVPAWATPDPGFLALMQASNSQPQQVATPVTTPPAVSPGVPAASGAMSSENYRIETKRFQPVERQEAAEMMMVLRGNTPKEFPITINADLEKGDKLVFRRCGRFVAEAVVTDVVSGRFIEARITCGGGVRSQDSIFVKEGK